jgi:hypothetical protein
VNRDAWFRRLRDQLPGWKVWYAGTGGVVGTSGWYASPVAPDTSLDDARRSPYRLGPYRTPQDLRADARVRYGAGDTCDTCNQPWELCGHRQDELHERS